MMTQQLEAIRGKAMALHRQGKLAEALAAHTDALRLAPNAVGIWLSAAKLAHVLEQQEVSLRYFEQACILSQNHVLYEDCRVVEEFERFFIEAMADADARTDAR